MQNKPILCKFAIGFTLLFGAFVQAKPHNPVQISIGELIMVGPTRPIDLLAKAVKNDSKSSQFRVTWSDSGMGGCDATILYDRKNHTLKQYSSGSRKVSNKPEKWIAEQQARIYSSVSDKTIFRLRDKVKGRTQYTPEDAYFSELKSLGCSKEGLFYRTRYYSP